MLASTLLAIFAKNVVPVLASFFSCYSCLLCLFYPNSFSLAFLPVKKWFGVGASKLSALSLLAVVGWLFTIFSTSVKTVIIWKYVSILSLTMLNRDAFTTRMPLHPGTAHMWWAWRIKFPSNMLLFSKFSYLHLIETAMFQSQFFDSTFEVWSTVWHSNVWFASSADESSKCINEGVSIHILWTSSKFIALVTITNPSLSVLISAV